MQPAIQFRAESYIGKLAATSMKATMNESPESLEVLSFEGYLSALFELNELMGVQYQKDKLDPAYFEAWKRCTKTAVSVPRIIQVWSKAKSGYRGSFVEYIDRLIATP